MKLKLTNKISAFDVFHELETIIKTGFLFKTFVQSQTEHEKSVMQVRNNITRW